MPRHDGFWSVCVYNRDRFFEKNEHDAYSVNSANARPEPDGSVTIHFGGDPARPNFLYTPEGWSYAIRFYRPHREVLDGFYDVPQPQPVQ